MMPAPSRTMADCWLTGPPPSMLTRFGEPPRFREGLYRAAPNSYAWMVPNGSWGETNLGLLDCRGESVLIDTGWDPRHTRGMLHAASDLLERSPIEHVVNTHADGDHCWGNQLFADKPIIATHACIHQMHDHHPRQFRALGACGRLLRHLPMGGLDRFGHYMHQMFRPYAFDGIRLTGATQGFSREHHLMVRGVDILITEVGPGHTDGDCIVHVPERGVVYAGDLVFVGVTPVAWAGPVDNIVAALRRLLDLDTDVIVPGHGPLASPQDIQLLIDYWEFVQNGLYQKMREGMDAVQATRALMNGQVFRHSIFATWDSPERLLTSAHTLYRGWGMPAPLLPGPLASLELMRQQAALAFEWPQATPGCMHRF